MNIKIRNENSSDFIVVENLIREAFWNLYKPWCDEHFIAHEMRKLPVFVKELDFVACEWENIVWVIMYTKAKVINDKWEKFEVLCMGPLAVLPSSQKKWIGSLLMNHTKEIAKNLGYKAIIIFWNPNYYHRFGFVNAEKYKIQTSSGENFAPFMVLELYEGALDGISWKFFADKVFEANPDEVEAFDKNFSPKEKKKTSTQLFI